MSPNILITGAAGYIGGSLITDLSTRNTTIVKKQHVYAAIRSNDQARALAESGVHVLQLDLTHEKAVVKTILENNISIIIHTASSIDPSLALPLITALGKQQDNTGRKTCFIHTSGLSAFYEKTGWESGTFEDSGPVFEVEKRLQDSFPIRKTDVAVIEHAKSLEVTSFIVIPSTVYGRGSGPWNQLSVVMPVYVKACISRRRVYRFAENTKVSGVHITDLTDLYGKLVEKFLQGEAIPNGTNGYYFALAHNLFWWEVTSHLADALKARDLIADTEIQTWPSDEAAAEALGVPAQFVHPLWNSGENIRIFNPARIGWKPTWNKERFLENIGGEVQAVVELGEAKSSLISSLFAAAK